MLDYSYMEEKKLFVNIIYQMKWLFTLKEKGDEYWTIQYIFITSMHLKALRVWIVIELLFISFGQWMSEYLYTRCCIHIQFVLHNFRRFICKYTEIVFITYSYFAKIYTILEAPKVNPIWSFLYHYFVKLSINNFGFFQHL